MSEKLLSLTKILLKRKYALLAVLILVVLSALSLGYSKSTSAAGICGLSNTFMCDFNTDSSSNTSGNSSSPGPALDWTNSGISQGGSGTNSDPYQVPVGDAVTLNLGYYSQAGSQGQHVYSWTNIDPSNLASNVLGGISASGGDASTVFSNDCFDVAFPSSSPYYNAAFAVQASANGGVVSCDGQWPCEIYPTTWESGCALSASPGGYAVTGHGASAVWYEGSYSGGYTVTHNLSIGTQSPGEFCLRNHVATSTAGWINDPNYLAAAGRNVQAQNYSDICFTAVAVPVNPPPSCSEVAIASPGANNQALVRVEDSNNNVQIPGGSTPSTGSPTTSNYQGDGVYPSWEGTPFYIVDSTGGGTWAYTVLGQNVRVIIIYRHDDMGTWTTTGYSDQTINCYNVSLNPGGACQVTVNGNVPGGPANAVEAGSTFTATATVTDNGPGDAPGSLGGAPLQVDPGTWNYAAAGSTGSNPGFGAVSTGPISHGSSVAVQLTLVAPGTVTAENIIAHPAYSGLFAFGPGSDCAATVDVYQPFSLTVNSPTATFVGDPENPTSVNYSTSVSNNSGSPPVQATDTSTFSFTPSQTNGSITEASKTDTYDYGSHTELSGTYNIPQLRPGDANVTAGDTYCTSINIDYTTGWVGPGGPADVVPTNGPINTTSNPCAVVVNKPFFKVYGSGVSSGGLLADWNNNTSLTPYDYGGGSELANIATGNINGYASAQQTSGDVRPPPDLDFANNNNNSPADAYTPGTGGNSGSTSSLLNQGCVVAGATNWGAADQSEPSAGSYTSGGDLTLGAMSIDNGQNVCLNVTGKVYISGPIKYTGANGNTWTVGTHGNVPSFTLNVTGGNIYIAPGVGELDGLYAAEPGGGGGTIYTCGNANFTAMSGSSLYTGCNKQLTVFGSFEAQSVNLMRTYGTLRDETPVERSVTTVTGYDQPVRLAQYTCGTGNPSNFYQQGHWYEAVNSDGSLARGATGPPAASCPSPTLQAYDGYIFPPGDTTFTGSHLNGSYTFLCEYQLTISGTDDHYVLPLASASDCQDKAPGNPFPDSNGVPLGYIANSNSSGTEPLYENFDGAYCGYGSSGFHSLSITNNAEPDNNGSSCGSPATVWGYVFTNPATSTNSFPETETAPVLGPPLPLTCSNNGGGTSSRPTCAAEVFDFSPEFYLSNPPTTGGFNSASSAFQIYNLPPVL
jgi:hypothetical protein